MLVNGDGIAEFQFKTHPGYRIDTRLSLKWVQLSSGNWVATDRGTTEDIYEAEVFTTGTESVINNIIDQLQANRIAGSGTPNQITLSSFSTSEKIFGENVNHTSINATVLNQPKRAQVAWKTYSVSLLLRAISPTFSGSSSLPTLKYCEVGAEQDADFTIKKSDSHNGTFSYADHRSDSGIFDAVFTLTTANMILIRNYIQNQRGGNFTLADSFGIAYPFGKRSSNSYPFTCKLIEWEDLGLFGLLYNRIRLKFAEAV